MTTATTSPITAAIAARRSQGQTAFMPFLTAGDPDLETTKTVINLLADAGADLIELGFPYSDPIADGPVIQASYQRALESKVKVHDILVMVKSLDQSKVPPIVGMVSYAIIFRYGSEKFLSECQSSHFSGLIVPDLPAEEAEDFAALTKTHGLDLIQLLAPTTTWERTQQIVKHSSGFVYCIAVAGTTGERRDVAGELIEQLKKVKTTTDTPLCVGFGISQPEHINPLRNIADGVIVGSAIVRYFEKLKLDKAAGLAFLKDYATTMATAAHQKG